MQLILFDDSERTALYPFTHTRPAADLRCGILTARARWERLLGFERSYTLTVDHLQGEYPLPSGKGEYLLVNGRIIGSADLAQVIKALKPGEQWIAKDSSLIAARFSGEAPLGMPFISHGMQELLWGGHLIILTRPWDIFSFTDEVLRADYTLLTNGKTSPQAAPEDCIIRGAEDLFSEEGVKLGAGTVINAESGPVFIARGAEVMEGCMLRGPLYVGEGAVIKMGAKIYGGTSIGPGCKVGGEVQNVVFFANSNKGHDGYLGNAVIGEWCNLGADTNCSNLKNDYSPVKIIDEATGRNTATGLTFCGLMMGDHSKCGINTMFNTGTVVGVSCNIWGAGFPEKFFPSFTWGGPQDGYKEYRIDRALETARRVMARRNRELSEAEASVLTHVFHQTAPLRSKQAAA